MKKQFFSGATGRIILHILAWTIILILPRYLSNRYFGSSSIFNWFFIVNTATYLLIFYTNYLLLVPKLFLKGKKLLYFLSALVLLVGVYYLTEAANESFFKRQMTIRLSEVANRLPSDTVTMAELLQEAGRASQTERENGEDGSGQPGFFNPFGGQGQPGRFSGQDDSGGGQGRMPGDSMRYGGFEPGIGRFPGDTSARVTSAAGNRFPGDTTVRGAFAGGTRYPDNGNRGGVPPPNNGERRPGPMDSGGLSRMLRSFLPFQIYNYSIAALFLTFFSLGLKVLDKHSLIEKKQKELEREKLNSELAFLKNQISPHFFFNTLNNIYSLIDINTKDSQNAILKLSKLMRYLLYETEQGHSTLSREIEFMNNYIDLMKLRMSDKVSLSVSFPDQYKDFPLPPLLFIPFVENAFKFGVSYREKSFIDITLEIVNNKLIFRSNNSISKPAGESSQKYAGIGLENVTKRLKLLFPEKHRLTVNKAGSSFNVLLEIDIEKSK